MGRLWVVGGIAVLLAGCAAIQGVRETFRAHQEMPYQHGEVPVEETAQNLVEGFKQLPGVGPFAQLLFWPVVGVLGYVRGRRIKLARGAAASGAITGWAGKVTRVEWIAQALASLSAGIFEVGKDGTSIKRTWKVLAAGVLAAGVLSVPGVQDFVTSNSETVTELLAKLTAGVLVLTAGFMGTEKALSVVKPVEGVPV